MENLSLAVEIGDESTDNNLDRAVRAQIISVVEQLKQVSILKTAYEAEKLKIVGAWYNIETGLVEMTVE